MTTRKIVLLLMVSAGAAWAAAMSGQDVLQRSADADGALKTYVGTTTIRSTAQFGGRKLEQTATAKIRFSRPGKLRIDGKMTMGQPFTIISDGTNTWLSRGFTRGGAFEKAQSTEMAIAAMTGVAARAPTTIPAA